jgi:hypothetical protein
MHTTLDDTIEIDATTHASTASVPAATATAPPGMKLVDPFAHYAASEGDAFFDGDYVKLDQKLGWICGQEKKLIGATETFVAAVHDARHGWISFGENTERHTELIIDKPELLPCFACGGTAQEHDDNPKQCDWRPVVYLPLRSATNPNDDAICFTGTGKGARKALGQLCGTYRRSSTDRQGKSPVLILKSRSFPNGSGGTTAWPVFKIVGWEFFTPGVPAPEPTLVAVSIAPPSSPATPKLAGAFGSSGPSVRERAPALAGAGAGKGGDLDDKIPF